mmetsp:Transcript_5595/g.16601  ORF Transcript_5595/g.16601 Transcript_5595/m.16601 type:complete len:338 (+) Transcript_5595:1483-2496(+)
MVRVGLALCEHLLFAVLLHGAGVLSATVRGADEEGGVQAAGKQVLFQFFVDDALFCHGARVDDQPTERRERNDDLEEHEQHPQRDDDADGPAEQFDEPEQQPQQEEVQRGHDQPRRQANDVLSDAGSQQAVGVVVGDGRHHAPQREVGDDGHHGDAGVQQHHQADPVLEVVVALRGQVVSHGRGLAAAVEEHAQLGAQHEREEDLVGGVALRDVVAQVRALGLRPRDVALPEHAVVHRHEVLQRVQQPDQAAPGVRVGQFQHAERVLWLCVRWPCPSIQMLFESVRFRTRCAVRMRWRWKWKQLPGPVLLAAAALAVVRFCLRSQSNDRSRCAAACV